MKKIMRYVAPTDWSGKTLNQVLKNNLKLSQEVINRIKPSVRINGMHQNIKHNISFGDILEFDIGDYDLHSHITPVFGTLDILYEDEYIIIINKSPGMPVHPSVNNYGNTLGNYLSHYFMQKSLPFKLRISTRLDKDTSGAVLLGLDQMSSQNLNRQISEKSLNKEYICLVDGIVENDCGVISAPIARKEQSMIERTVSADGKYAVTKYEVIKRNKTTTLLKLRLLTGRTHQIRVHTAHIGHPVTGDTLYGMPSNLITRQALHMSVLSFLHPITNEPMQITAPLPEDVLQAIQADSY